MKLNQLLVLGTACLVTAFSVASCAPKSTSLAPTAQPTVTQTVPAQSGELESGTFIAAEKPTTGTARIIAEAGHRYLELDSAFSTSNQGPDLHVLLESAAQPPQSYSNLGSAVNLGKLSGYSGVQRYPVPDAINLADFRSVVIWCRMANATFGYAPLQSHGTSSVQ